VLPAKNPVITRLGKLGYSGQTGVLHLSGESAGSIHLSRGSVVYAESARTPGLPARLEKMTALTGGAMVSSLERDWMAKDATADAALELLSGKPRHMRFRAPGELDLGITEGMTVTLLVTEVNRRHNIMRQLSAVLTPDTAVARNPRLKTRSIGVSDIQWAIAMRVNSPVTPRSLALELGQSVLGTTIAVFRMVTMDLLSVVDPPAGSADETRESDQNGPAISFIRALVS